MIEYRTLYGADATQEELDTFVELVRSGGAVDENMSEWAWYGRVLRSPWLKSEAEQLVMLY